MAVAWGAFVSIDCAEPTALAEFWAAMLGGDIVFANERTVVVRTASLWIAALAVDDYVAPTWPESEVPKQMHLDLAVTDLEESVAMAEQLGARSAGAQPAPDRWHVLFDPAGHPFCLTTQVPRPSRSAS